MTKWGFTHIVVSIPRLVVGAILTGAVIGSVQFMFPSQQAHSQNLQPTAVTIKTTLPYTAAPQTVTQPTPTPTTPATETVTAKPTVTSPSTLSTATTPAVAASPNANVNELAPTSNTSSNSGYTSTNWSGYLMSTINASDNFSGISGSWMVPRITSGAGETAADATWIGIGGVTSSDLIQVGTTDTVTASGHETSSVFYELMPSASRTIISLRIAPGDVMGASLSEITAGQWKLTITDKTTGRSYSKLVAYNSSNSTAEWIEEDPSTTTNQPYPLDKFGDVAFSSASATQASGPITPATGKAQPITMISSNGSSLAVPSALGIDGESFTVTQK